MTIELALGEISVRVITIDEVIASKEKLGCPKDTAVSPIGVVGQGDIQAETWRHCLVTVGLDEDRRVCPAADRERHSSASMIGCAPPADVLW